jgi:hypothetical protein
MPLIFNDIPFRVSGRILRTVALAKEFYQNVNNPELIISFLIQSEVSADIFTFLGAFPENIPTYRYHYELDNLAVIPITSFDYWWQKQIPKQTRTHVRKAQRRGISINLVNLSERFVTGVMEIYNESPIRQGKPFLHYGIDYSTMRADLLEDSDTCDYIGAYLGDELIGFLKLLYGNCWARTVNVLSMIKHRGKSPTNALLAKAVEICAEKHLSYLIYGKMVYGSANFATLTQFKLENGFTRFNIPRYYVPLSKKGEIALRLKLHHGITGLLPPFIATFFLNLRKMWFLRRSTRTFTHH